MISNDEVRQLKENIPQVNEISKVYLKDERTDDGKQGEFPCFDIQDENERSIWQICDQF